MIHITDTNPNPNDITLCGTEDCHGPYVVFSAFELDDVLNPHPVVCMHHIDTDIVPRLELWEAENYVDAESEEVEDEDTELVEI